MKTIKVKLPKPQKLTNRLPLKSKLNLFKELPLKELLVDLLSSPFPQLFLQFYLSDETPSNFRALF